MQSSLLQELANGRIIVGDGAMGTTLQKQGLPPGTLPELWNAVNPEAIAQIHRDYMDAGAQFITTNTLNCNIPMMLEAGIAERRLELARLGVEIAISAAAGKAWVGASLGPTGQLLEPLGSLTLEALELDYRQQVEVFAAAGADFIKLETHQDIEEACAGIRMAKRYTHLPVWCTFAFNTRGRTLMGLRAADAALRLQEEGADIVGANCGEGPAAIEAALSAMHPVTSLPLAAQSNAGIPKLGDDGKTTWDVSPAQMGEYAKSFIALGAQILAGCCGTSPAYIRAMVNTIKSPLVTN
ncbi:MAG: homocysteine S-methyltransferase family protein [Anaerolineae bacterium]